MKVNLFDLKLGMQHPIVDVFDAFILARDDDIAKTQAILDDIEPYDLAFMIHLTKLKHQHLMFPLTLNPEHLTKPSSLK